MAWLTGWTRRKIKVVNNLTISDYQMQLIVHKSGLGPDTSTDIYLGDHCRNDFADLRFTDPDQTTLLSYWIESIASGVATVWIKIPTLTPTNNIYIYYDNPTAATSLSSGTNTFLFFDNYDINAFVAGWTNVAYSLDSTGYCDWGETLAAQNQRREYIRPAGGDSNPAKWCGKRSLVTSATYNTFAMEAKQISFSPSGGGNHGDMNSMSGFIIFKDNSNRFHIGIGAYGGGAPNYYIDYFIGGGRTFTGPSRTVVPSRIKLTYDGTTIIFYTDEGSGYIQKYSVNLAYSSFNIGLLDQIRYGNCGLTEYTDDFLIRQFISPEPTFGTSGTEELNITATLMSLDKTSCLGPCPITATVTWHNYGNADITSFTTAVLIDDTTLAYGASISILAGGDASSGAITTPTLSAGSHTICPYPN